MENSVQSSQVISETVSEYNPSIPEYCPSEDNYENSASRVLKLYRPRGALARTLYQKQIFDEQLRNTDKRKWYECNLSKMPKDLVEQFVPLDLDYDTQEFLHQSEQKSEWILTQLWHSLAKAFLGWFMSQTSINGLLGRGSMFVFSQAQFRFLLNVSDDWKAETCLDLGAGDGAVTTRIAPLFQKVFVTEVSQQMRNILQKQNFTVLEIDNWHLDHTYDVIMCLNLLDRCDYPLQILKTIHDTLAPNGRLVMALVLPFASYVETGVRNDHRPVEVLNITGKTFEQQVESFVTNILQPSGFRLIRWSRVPYLCEGDINQSYYFLDDALFICEKDN